MLVQAEITKNVIDSGLRFPHVGLMLSHDEIKEELIRQIDAKTVTQVAVARHLSIAPARIAEVRSGRRRIQPGEMAPLAEFLGLADADPLRGLELGEPVFIQNLGKVAQGVWLEQSSNDAEQDVVPFDRRPKDPKPIDLFAVTPEGTSMNRRFPKGTKLICRRVPFGSGDFRSGQYVIVSRTAHELRELTCKRLEIDNKGVYWLHSESDDPKFADPWKIGKPRNDNHSDTEITIEGRVIRAVQEFDNV